jgi:glycosyltransferase involved in cell wall biosynthesis
MIKYGIVTSYTTSLKVVGADIANALTKLGYPAKLYTRQVQWYDAVEEFDAGIVFIPFDPIYALAWFLLQRDYTIRGIPSITYVTVEGTPKKQMIPQWVKRDCTFVACSNFVKEMLETVDVRVKDVVPHGVDIATVENLKERAVALNKQIKQKMGVKTVFGTVVSNHPRKGLQTLYNVAKKVIAKNSEIGFYIVTTEKGAQMFKGMQNTIADPSFGEMDRNEALATIGSFDYYVQPSYCEGFGLPVLEAQAFGRPCILPQYPPLTEISHPTANLWVPVEEASPTNLGDGILYYCHFYSEDKMAEQILEAHQIHTSSKQEYSRMSRQLVSHAKNYDILKTYKKFIDII